MASMKTKTIIVLHSVCHKQSNRWKWCSDSIAPNRDHKFTVYWIKQNAIDSICIEILCYLYVLEYLRFTSNANMYDKHSPTHTHTNSTASLLSHLFNPSSFLTTLHPSIPWQWQNVKFVYKSVSNGSIVARCTTETAVTAKVQATLQPWLNNKLCEQYLSST